MEHGGGEELQSSRIPTEYVDIDKCCTQSATSIDPLHIETHGQYPNTLFEMDWMSISAYIDNPHMPLLYILCPSTYVSPTCLGVMEHWYLVLRYLNDEMLQIMVTLLSEGAYAYV